MNCVVFVAVVFIFVLFSIEVELIYNVVLVSGVQQSDSVIRCCCS